MTDDNNNAPLPPIQLGAGGPIVNEAQALSAVRWVVTFGGGYALGHGWLTNQQLVDIGGIAAALVPLVWSYFVHRAPKAQ